MAVVPINYIEISHGKAHIAGSRIRVMDIVAMCVLNNTPIEWVVENYDLTPAQIHAALSYYYDHQEEIDAALEEANRLAEEYLCSGAMISSEEHLAQLRARKASQ